MTPMKTLTFWFDPISPYAYLAFEHLPQALEGCSYVVDYRPLLFAGLLGHWGQLGPAEIEPKRAWTFRQVAWHAHRLGITMDTPSQHPFNPLALLRLGLASAPAGGLPNRRVVELLMHHAWRGGGDANDPARLQALAAAVAPQRDPASEAVKAELRAHTEVAIERGVFGVPSFELDGRLFWGLDALPMLRAALQGDPWFDGPAWADAAVPRGGVVRGR
jgi:2-hydroxychromene-2-carboxylate isomerase